MSNSERNVSVLHVQCIIHMHVHCTCIIHVHVYVKAFDAAVIVVQCTLILSISYPQGSVCITCMYTVNIYLCTCTSLSVYIHVHDVHRAVAGQQM